MAELFDPVVKAWNALRRGTLATPQVSTLPRFTPVEAAGYPIVKDRMYFELRVSELHLADNREWWSAFDPMVVVVAEYDYGREHVARPAVVGPSLIRTQAPTDQPRHGVVLLDSLVVGPNPYRGGNVDVSVSFYRVKRSNSARALLKMVDHLSGALPGAGEMAAVAKVGGALLDGVEGLLGLEDTTYLAGHRLALRPTPLDPLTACFSALVAPPAPPPGQLMVQDRRLYVDDGAAAQPYRGSDFVLLSLAGTEARGNEHALSFYALKEEALAALAGEGEEALKRGKANLIAAYQQMRQSNDVTPVEAGRLFEIWLKEFEDEEKRYERMRAMPLDRHVHAADALRTDLNAAVGRLKL